jgi:hypothetical protein
MPYCSPAPRSLERPAPAGSLPSPRVVSWSCLPPLVESSRPRWLPSAVCLRRDANHRYLDCQVAGRSPRGHSRRWCRGHASVATVGGDAVATEPTATQPANSDPPCVAPRALRLDRTQRHPAPASERERGGFRTCDLSRVKQTLTSADLARMPCKSKVSRAGPISGNRLDWAQFGWVWANERPHWPKHQCGVRGREAPRTDAFGST